MIKKMKIAAAAGALGMILNLYATPLMAFGFGIGGSFGGAHVEASGTETHKTGSTKSRSKDAGTPIASAYAQIIVGDSVFGEGNGFAVGIQQFFGEASMSETKETTRTNIISAVGATESGTQYANVVFSDLRNIFIETPGFTPLGIFLKAGYAEMNVKTEENLYTGGTFGDATVDGSVVGFGFKKSAGGFQVKTEVSYTDWDTISLNNTGTDAGSTKVTGTPEHWAATVGIGWIF